MKVSEKNLNESNGIRKLQKLTCLNKDKFYVHKKGARDSFSQVFINAQNRIRSRKKGRTYSKH